MMTGVAISLSSAALARAAAAAAAELGTRLMMGLIPLVLSVLLRETLESVPEWEPERLEIGVGGTELSSVRVNAWSTTPRNPDSSELACG